MRPTSSAPRSAVLRNLTQASLLAASLGLLQACGGGDTPAAASPAPAPAPAPAATPLAPLPGGSSYLGTLSVGDTVRLALDEAHQQISIVFVESRFGLSGSIVSSYLPDGQGQYLAEQFKPAAGTSLPAALSAQLAQIQLRFHARDEQINGSLSGLPNLLGASNTAMQAQLTAYNQGAEQVAALAGVYNYVRQEIAYSAQGQPGQTLSSFGQIRIGSDGSLRVCPGQAMGDGCSSASTGSLSSETDQPSYPGALAVELDGMRLGRAMVGKRNGGHSISIDAFRAGSGGGFATGNWLLQPADQALATNTLDGEWLCTAPGQSGGRSLRHYVSIGNGLLQTDMIDSDLALTANAAAAGGRITTAVNGMFAGRWQDSSAATRTLLPVNGDTFYYLDQAAQGGAALTGLCHRLPEQPVLGKYLSASAASTEPVMISLADARPTQPAIGFDQIYYKQGRYRHVATGSVVSTQWQKAFDDLCEDSGMDSSAKNGVSSSSRLNDRSTFTCKARVANYQGLLKTAVVGPKGQLFLTDGHHSFTSLWEAPNGNGNPAGGLAGGQVQMPVMIKGNYRDLNNAGFWRSMRAQKFVWLKLPDGTAITPAELPRQLGLGNGLKDDPYRSLVYFTREVGYDKPVNPSEFLEFYWSEWLQAAPRGLKLSSYDLSRAGNGADLGYLQAVRDAANFMLQANPGEPIAASGYNAQQMGQLAAFGSAVFNDLATPKPADGKKAGKLAYALEYRTSLSGRP